MGSESKRGGRRRPVGVALAALSILAGLGAVGHALAATGPPTTVTVTLSPTTIPANGTAASTATVRVTDASGNGVSGQSVTLASSDAGDAIGTVTDHGDGSYTATITGSSAPGQATITATDTTASLQGARTLYQYGSPASVSVSLNPPQIVADGASTATATATVMDALGDPIPGKTVTISSNAGNALGAVSANGNGTYSATVTSTTTASAATITADDSTDGLSGQGTLTQTAGPATSVAVSLSPSSIVADGKSTTTATATVTDQFGNRVAGDTVLWSSDDPGNLFGALTDHGDGTYSATITSSTTVHGVKVSAMDQATSISGSATLTQAPGPPASVTVSVTPSQIVADGTSSATATATVEDAEGHLVPGQTVTFSSSDAGQTIGGVSDHGDGTYSTTITSSTTVGQPTITAHVGGLASGPASLTQTVGSAASIAIVVNPSQIVADGTSTATATATVTDAEGHPVTGETVTFSPSDSGEKIGAVADHGDGTYTVTITSSTTVGQATITAHDGGLTSGPSTLTQTVGPAATVTLGVSPPQIVADGASTTTATATVKDAEGHPLPGETVTFSSSDAGQKIGAVTDHGDGTYSATITSSTIVGQPAITAHDGAVTSGPGTITQTSGPAATVTLAVSPPQIVADGASTTTATATVKDAEGHPLPGETVTFSSSDAGERIGAMIDHGDGTYTATVTSSTTVGQATITAHDAGLSGTATVTQASGPAATITLAVNPSQIIADGTSTATATATVKDAEGHPVTGARVTLSSGDRNNRIGPVTDNGDGTYTATIGSSTSLGQVTIAAHDGGLTGTATLTQTRGTAATVTVSLAPRAIVADGTSITTATATVTDAAGNPIAGDAVHFASSDPGNQIGAVADDGHGSYNTTITASSTVGQVTITASDGAASGGATLTQTKLPATRMTLTLPRGRILADGRATTIATVAVEDDSGHGIAHQAIGVLTSDPGVGVGVASDQGDGTYLAALTGSRTVHTVVVTAIDYSVSPALTAKATLALVPGAPSGITLSFKPRSVRANGRAKVTVTATVTDASGHPLVGQRMRFASSDRRMKIGRVRSQVDGTYTVAITSSKAPITRLVTIRAIDLSASPTLSVQALLSETRPPDHSSRGRPRRGARS